jgi:SAM-dependent methyltransferase
MAAVALCPHELYAAALARPGAEWWIRFADGGRRRVPVARWLGPAAPADRDVLARAVGPVLDVGCGPGRHLHELAARGVEAIGIDASPAAVALARRSGARVVQASIWAPGALAGQFFSTVLLLDGNLGLGGRPLALLRRCAALLADDGRVLVEAMPPRSGGLVRLEGPPGSSRPFPWSFVGLDALPALAARAGLRVAATWHRAGRPFARLERPGAE